MDDDRHDVAEGVTDPLRDGDATRKQRRLHKSGEWWRWRRGWLKRPRNSTAPFSDCSGARQRYEVRLSVPIEPI